MNCTSCGALLDSQVSGFIVCPRCGSVNIPATDSLQVHTPIIATELPNGDASMPVWTKRSRAPTKLPLFITVGLTVLVLAGGLIYQHMRANALLQSAHRVIANENYEPGLHVLNHASSYYALPTTKHKILAEIKQDKIWIADSQTLKQATILESQGNHSQAAALAASIHQDFPGYKKVTALVNSINQQVAATAPKALPTTTIPVSKPSLKPIKPTMTQNVVAPKRFSSVAAAGDLAAARTVAEAAQALQKFASQYGLTIEITNVSPSSYVTQYSTYTLLNGSDLDSLKTYGALFIDEWAKYPTDWVTSSKLKSVAIVKDLAISGTHRAAAPDPFGEAMYYDATYGGDYAREVVHHEFDHLLTYNYFGSYAPSDPTWQSYNTAGFSYGDGGASCYQTVNNCLTGPHPIPGFVSGYGASAIEEDKAELYAYLMTGTYYHQLIGWLPNDSNLTNKVNHYKQFISTYSPEMSGSYFSDIDP